MSSAGGDDGSDGSGLDLHRIVDRMERDVPPGSPDEAEARRPYASIARRIAALPGARPRDDLHARVLAQVRSESPRPRRSGTARSRALLRGCGLAFAAAAAATVALWCHGSGPSPGTALTVAIAAAQSTRSQGHAAVGDRLQIQASGGDGRVELRVYRDDRMVVLRCPGDARCRTGRGRLAAELPLTAAGRYRVVRFASRVPLPPPAGGFDADLAILRSAEGSLDEATVVVE